MGLTVIKTAQAYCNFCGTGKDEVDDDGDVIQENTEEHVFGRDTDDNYHICEFCTIEIASLMGYKFVKEP